MEHDFTDEELTTILELAFLNLSETDSFRRAGDYLDLSDEMLKEFSDKIGDFLQNIN